METFLPDLWIEVNVKFKTKLFKLLHVPNEFRINTRTENHLEITISRIFASEARLIAKNYATIKVKFPKVLLI